MQPSQAAGRKPRAATTPGAGRVRALSFSEEDSEDLAADKRRKTRIRQEERLNESHSSAFNPRLSAFICG
jgi:hypothetical protein